MLRSQGETRHYFSQTRTILKGEFRRGPRIAIRADNRRFRGSEVSLQPLSRRGTFNTIRVIFSMTGFLSEPDLRLFLRDGLVIGLFCLFRSPRIPLGISVEDHVLEIVGSDSESGVKMGDIRGRMR